MRLTEFLLARIAEDAQVARDGISGQADPENGWGYGGFGSPTALTPHVGMIHEEVQAAHIIRWHPARVLAECASKRQIVEDHVEAHRCEWGDWYPAGTCDAKVLRILASVWAAHPDFDEDWR